MTTALIAPANRTDFLTATEHPTWAAAREAAGLTWEPTAAPVLKTDAAGLPMWEGMNDDGTPRYAADEDYKKITRGPGGNTLGVVKSGYEIIDHTELGRMIEPLLEVDGTELLGLKELDGGAKILATIRIGSDRTLGGDFSPTMPYMALLAGHGGKGSIRAIATGSRFVCTNQFNAASIAGAKNRGHFVSVTHTRNWRAQAEEMRRLCVRMRGQFESIAEQSEELSRMTVTARQHEEFIKNLLPYDPAAVANGEPTLAVRRQSERREQLREIIASPTTAPIAGTAFGLVQGAIELAQWSAGRQSANGAERRIVRNVLTDQPLVIGAAKVARQVALAG